MRELAFLSTYGLVDIIKTQKFKTTTKHVVLLLMLSALLSSSLDRIAALPKITSVFVVEYVYSERSLPGLGCQRSLIVFR